MALVRWNDSGDFDKNFSTMLDRFFNEAVRTGGNGNFRPTADVSEDENSYHVEMHVPGMKKEDLSIEIQQNQLTISGEKEFKNEENKKKYHIVESSYGSFKRVFGLPEDVKAENIEADYKDGVLHIHIPKDKEKTTARQVKVK